MAGSLKVVCTTGQTRYANTAAFGSLNAQTAFTVSGWFEIASLGTDFTNCDLFGAVTSYPVTVGIANNAHLQLFAESAGGASSISYQPLVDTKGHFIVISYSADFVTTIYVDGAPAKTIAGIGATAAVDQVLNVGFNAAGAAVTLYLKDVAIWSGYSATQADVIALRDGVSTPGTLATPATNWWTLQGPAGAVTAGTQGLADSLGSVNLGTLVGTGTLTYDAHEIILGFSARMLDPYVDTSGNLIVIPLYGDPDTTLGGPATPVSINVVPTFKLNGSVITPTLASSTYFGLYGFVYEMPSRTGGVAVAPGDVLTMSAPMGWASTNFGLVEGTSGSGLGSGPMTLINNTHAVVESAYDITKTMKIGYNTSGLAQNFGSPGQPRANWVSRVSGWRFQSGLAANGLPSGNTPGTPCLGIIMAEVVNLIDNRYNAGIQGLWTLPYGDASIGVTGSAPNVICDLQFNNPSFTAVQNPHGTDSPGHWDGTAWHGITKTYLVTYDGTGPFGSDIALNIDSVNGHIGFPDMGGGQVELGIFPPSPADRGVSSPTTWDPLAGDPEFFKKLEGAACVRWMADLGGFSITGDSAMIKVGDLAQRAVTDFLWSTNTTITSNIIKVEPIVGWCLAVYISACHASVRPALPMRCGQATRLCLPRIP